MPKDLPPNLEKYAETPVFTDKTVPDKLTSEHDTKPGVWGKLVVMEGRLDYVVPGPPLTRQRLDAGDYGVIEPTVLHRVEIVGPVRFQVEFYRPAGSGADPAR